MILKYGSYAHENGEVQISRAKRAEYSPRGYRKGILHTIQITGRLHAASSAALTTAFNLLAAAYSVDGYELALYLPDGSTKTAIILSPSGLVGGTKVVQPPSFPTLAGAAYVTYLDYQITVEGFEPAFSSLLIDFKESIKFTGNGGPRRIVIETADTNPVEQIVRQRTVYRATQVGQATAYGGALPQIPPPIWPTALDNPTTSRGEDGPIINSGSVDTITVNWSYSFTSPTPLNGRPHIG